MTTDRCAIPPARIPHKPDRGPRSIGALIRCCSTWKGARRRQGCPRYRAARRTRDGAR